MEFTTGNIVTVMANEEPPYESLAHALEWIRMHKIEDEWEFVCQNFGGTISGIETAEDERFEVIAIDYHDNLALVRLIERTTFYLVRIEDLRTWEETEID